MIVPYTVEQTFEVVNDVARYHEFLPGCECSTVFNRTCTTYDARLNLVALGIQKELITRNTPKSNRSLAVELVQGPFIELQGTWRFQDYGEGCRVTLDLDCDFATELIQVFSSTLLKRGIARTVDAFIKEVRRRREQD